MGCAHAVDRCREGEQLFAFGKAEVRGVLSRFRVQSPSPTTSRYLVSSFLICEIGMIAPRPAA